MLSTDAELLGKIRHLRNYCCLSQESVAREMGMSQPAYSKLENGITRLTVPFFHAFATLVGISFIDLLTCPVDELIRQIKDQKLSTPPRK